MTPAIDCSRQTIHTIHIHIIHIAIVGWLKRDLRRRFDTLTGFHLPKPIQLELDLDPHWLPSPPWPPRPNEWHGMNWTSSHKFAIQNRLIDSHRLKMWCSEQIDLVMFCLLILCPTVINAFVYLFVPFYLCDFMPICKHFLHVLVFLFLFIFTCKYTNLFLYLNPNIY